MKILMYYWNKSKKNVSWEIAYRLRNNLSIIDDKKTTFKILETKKDTWGADPFLFKHDGKTYLFFELFIKSKRKGVIAVSVLENGVFSKSEIVLEEPFHMSFPCIFSLNNNIYMIPETGSQHTLLLYKCDSFPYRWHKEKTLLENISSSDSIVISRDSHTYILVSSLKGDICTAENILYELNSSDLTLEYCCLSDGFGTRGFRNAGMLFQNNGNVYRPGQNCENKQYGKSIILWLVTRIDSHVFKEEYYGEITANDIIVDSEKIYSGIHTYNILDKYEVIDLKIISSPRLIARLVYVFGKILNIIYNRINKYIHTKK